MKRLFAFFVALTLLIPVAFADSLGDLVGNMTSLFSSDDESNTYAPGETAELNGYDIKLTNVFASDGNSYYSPDDGNIFIILEFDIKNKTEEDIFVSSMMCFSLSVDGVTYSIDIGALATATLSGKTQMDLNIAPGKTVNGIVGYQIPKTWNELKITVKPEAYSGERATFIMQQ